ncbi:head-tail connector protein [Brevundimonas sp. DC300-4]|uniref:head-tail connector protein n=1 Tax=Brevundimonas sp. DC300-4 TaxID=2804594 RepID=UPI003CEF60D7
MARSFAYSPVRTVAPTSAPVSLTEAKTHLRVDHGDEDTLIQAFIDAATAHLDGWSGVLGRALVTQTWSQVFDRFEPRLRLPMPAATVTGVTCVDPDGLTLTLDDEDYVLRTDALGSFVETVHGVNWPATRDQTGTVSVTFTCGEPGSSVPAPITAAILLMVGDLYASREGVVTGTIVAENPTVAALIAPYRRVGV